MPYCTKCGAEVGEDMVFCTKCGASLKVEPGEWRRRAEKEEKEEKEEKGEKEEKREKTEAYEKREFAFIGPLIGGLVLIVLGLIFYLQIMGYRIWEIAGAALLIIVGIAIILGSIYATKRYPRP